MWQNIIIFLQLTEHIAFALSNNNTFTMTNDNSATIQQDVDEEDYNSAEDEDFELGAAQDDSDLSSDADEAAEPAKKKRKTQSRSHAPEDPELDSGDEITIQKAKEKKEKKRKGKKTKAKRARDSDDDDDVDMDDDEGGAGGFVRTRAMKKHIREEEAERKPLAKIDGATVDVDALWEQMNAPQPRNDQRSPQPPQAATVPEPEPTSQSGMQDQPPPDGDKKTAESHGDQMVKIKRTYKFAGEWITEEKVVPKHSAEAKAFLSSGENVEYTDEDAGATLNLRRPLRKISRFDPNPTGAIKKSWEKQLVAEKDAQGPKINTVEKSRLDWASYVDQAGIKDELRTHSKAKEGYMGRMDFLGRMENKREDERREARLKNM
ncbi:unnamed protein product [Penicillium salamii]|uniref:SWR1-complex protein 5 n=1 Tax=Penicillium salamii TaxID=1612424 RepID=A0A9W4JGE0_9EURO|nr:unnamed protein product [Penicillium salamii]CAG8239236.1 unnamed protein product [Penicillium salamii]CAG8320655.1 unnamed protein product [Penicillium salamii]CAG8363393.1 unnamed protein product [Penicillium salamii]CAG8388480.1 unnamed protein product [Penicillium salamii]